MAARASVHASFRYYAGRRMSQAYLLQFPGVVGLRPFGTVESVAGMPGNLVPRSWSLNERYA